MIGQSRSLVDLAEVGRSLVDSTVVTTQPSVPGTDGSPASDGDMVQLTPTKTVTYAAVKIALDERIHVLRPLAGV